MAAFKNKDNGTWYVQFRYPVYELSYPCRAKD